MKRQNKPIPGYRQDLLPSLLMTPALLIVCCIIVLPMFYGLAVSFFNFRLGDSFGQENFAGLSNYLRAVQDKVVWKSLVNTVLFSLGCVSGDLVFGTVIAVLLYRLPDRIAGILRAVLIMPMLVAPIVTGLMWSNLFDANGVIYWLLRQVNITHSQFSGVSGRSTALLCCIIAHWWQNTPFIIIMVTAGLMSIPEELYEAAYCDGGGLFNILRYVTLPLLKSVYMVSILISGVDTIKSFDIIYALTGGGPANASMTLNLYTYQQAFEAGDLSYSMALSVIVMLVALVCFGGPFIRYNMKKGGE